MQTSPAIERRLSVLREAMDSHNLGGVIISRPQHIFYFTGVMAAAISPSFLLISPQAVLAVASSAVGQVETIIYHDGDMNNGWEVTEAAVQALETALSRCQWSGRKVGAELAHLPAAYLICAEKHVEQMVDLEILLWRIRCRKDADEIRQIEANVAMNDQVYRVVQTAIRPGMAELELWGLIQRTINDLTEGPTTLEADIGVGERGSQSAAKPGMDQLLKGDAVFIDIYTATKGYYADTTRVFTVGDPTTRQNEVFDLLSAALEAGEKTLKPGMPAKEVDAAVRLVIEKAGYGEYFSHDSGHGYGIFQREPPYFSSSTKLSLEAGMIVAVEPGIYIPGWGGMRLESTYLIGEQGPQKLDRYPRQLIACQP